ncbi:hypothetical protein MSAN_02381400 [Mycena sanguinolenta]|uniref:Transmembrane protein n=1 Tax=Mycena sanguinolenta TaxID=230812 RepID=A0A8H6X550_9AGAR|nr:hypothetical protein MSAN_02381400 [Mycena sanguinolenta]
MCLRGPLALDPSSAGAGWGSGWARARLLTHPHLVHPHHPPEATERSTTLPTTLSDLAGTYGARWARAFAVRFLRLLGFLCLADGRALRETQTAPTARRSRVHLLIFIFPSTLLVLGLGTDTHRAHLFLRFLLLFVLLLILLPTSLQLLHTLVLPRSPVLQLLLLFPASLELRRDQSRGGGSEALGRENEAETQPRLARASSHPPATHAGMTRPCLPGLPPRVLFLVVLFPLRLFPLLLVPRRESGLRMDGRNASLRAWETAPPFLFGSSGPTLNSAIDPATGADADPQERASVF